jgi:hypothetical protein
MPRIETNHVQAILSKVRVVASVSHLLFSGLRYVTVYVPQTPGRARIFCSPRSKTKPHDLLLETLSVDGETLMQRFGRLPPRRSILVGFWDRRPTLEDIGARKAQDDHRIR